MSLPPKLRRLVPCFSFSAALAGVVLYSGNIRHNASLNHSATAAVPEKPVETGAPDDGLQHPSGELVDGLPVEALTLAGLTRRPGLEEVFACTGVDRQIRLALFLLHADAAELARAMQVCVREELKPGDPLLDLVWQRWVEVDVASARAWNGGNHSGVWTAWARVDPKAALAAAAENLRWLEPVVREIGRTDAAWADKLMAQHPRLKAGLIHESVVEQLAATEPAAAADLALEKGTGLEKTMRAWAAREPAQALAWTEKLDYPWQRRTAAAEVIRQWALTDPAPALEAALKLPPGRTTKQLVAESLTELARRDPAAARAAFTKVTPGPHRASAMLALADGLAVSDPRAALEVLRGMSWKDYHAQESPRSDWSLKGSGGSNSVYFGQTNPDPPAGALQILSLSHPRETAEALSRSAEGSSAAEVFGRSYGQWLGQDPEAASAWLRDLPAGYARTEGIRRVVHFTLENGPGAADFESALTWAVAAPGSSREGLMTEVLQHWQQADADAAAQAAVRYGISFKPLRIRSWDEEYDIFDGE